MDRSASKFSHSPETASNGEFEFAVLPPFPGNNVQFLIAAGRAGALPIIDATMLPNLPAIKHQISELRAALGCRFGIRAEGDCLKATVDLLTGVDGAVAIMVPGDDSSRNPGSRLSALVAAMHRNGIRVFAEAVCQREADAAVAAEVDGIVAKGNESGGRIGTETTFLLLQRFCGRLSIPVWAMGGVGLHSVAACRVAGAAGVLLQDQLMLAEEAKVSGFVRTLVEAMDGTETLNLCESQEQGFRVHGLSGVERIRKLQLLEVDSATTSMWAGQARESIRGTEDEWLLPVGQDAAFAACLAEQYQTVGEILRAFRVNAMDNPRLAAGASAFAEYGPLAQAHGTRFPIVQGPMTRVSDVASFAEAVARGGALPFLALALLRRGDCERILDETAERLGKRNWGVGILGFVPPDVRSEQLQAVLARRPRFAILAGGRPDQVRTLEDADIATYLHVPSPRLLEMFLRDGIRRFVFEGRECGGHVGPLSSSVLWNLMLDVLLDFQRDKKPSETIDVLFAGGIHDGMSAAMVAALAAQAHVANIRIGVLMGTSYLFTREAVSTGAIVPAFQEQSIRCQTTALLDGGGGHAIRCAPSKYAEEFETSKRNLLASGTERDEVRRRLEAMNVGRLRIASKGLTRVTKAKQGESSGELAPVTVKQQTDEGLYMMGQVAALRDRVCSIEELHDDVSHGCEERLRAFAGFEPSNGEARRRSTEPEPIAIIGIACHLPGARDSAEFWSNVLGRHDAIREVSDDRWQASLFYDSNPNAPDRIVSKWGGFLDSIRLDPVTYGIPPAAVSSIEPVHLLLLDAARRAMSDAGYDRRPFPRDRTAVIIGTGGGTSDLGVAYQTRCMVEHYLSEGRDLDPQTTRSAMAHLRRVLPELTEDSFAGILPNVAAGRIANRLDLAGPNFAVDAACASSLAAVDAAVKELRHGTSELALVGAAEGQQHAFSFLLFSKTQALSPRGRCRPFDATADGIAISEGVAVLVLKRLSDAERDGDRIYAVLRGVGAASDGRATSLTAPAVEGQRRALERAYESAHAAPASVGLVEAHGTGTVVGDRTELETLHQVFSEAGAAAQSCALGSVKSLIGHTKNTAGLAGLVKVALALHHRVLPPTMVDEVLPGLRDRSTPLYVNTLARPWFQPDDTKRLAGVSAFGFGGTNFHAVLEEFPAHTRPVSQRPAELIVFRARSHESLIRCLETLQRDLAGDIATPLVDLAAACSRDLDEHGEFRLAIVATDISDLRARIAVAIDKLRQHQPFVDLERITSGCGERAGRTAFLFPGQGSQRVNMLLELALYFPVAREVFESADRLLADALTEPLTTTIFPPPAYTTEEEMRQAQHLNQTWLAQPALGVADFAIYKLLTSLGLEPDMLAGHSYGEYVALCAAGTFTFADLMRLSERRGRAVQDTQGRQAVAMVAVQESAQAVARFIDADTNVSVAGENAADQTIVGGARDRMEAWLKRLDAAGIVYQPLPMSAGFHIPEAREAAERFSKELAIVQMRPPKVSVYSNREGAAYPSDENRIRKILVEQLTEPLQFRAEIEAMYQAGARTFVEVGPGQVLTGLVRRILGDRSSVVLATGKTSDNGLIEFLQVLARLWVDGEPVRTDQLFTGRCGTRIRLSELQANKPSSSPTEWLVNCGRARPLHEDNGCTDHDARTGGPPTDSAVSQRLNSTPNNAPSPVRRPTAIPSEPTKASAALATEASGGASQLLTEFQASMQRILDYQERSQQMRHEVMTHFLETQRMMIEALATGQTHQPASPMWISPASNTKSEADDARITYDFPPELAPLASSERTRVSDQSPQDATTPYGVPEDQESVNLHDILLDLISKRTGYPKDMLNPDQNLEAELGIDSIKRTEIFGSLLEKVGLATNDKQREEYFLTVTRFRTIREVLDWVQQQTTQALPQPETAEQPSGTVAEPIRHLVRRSPMPLEERPPAYRMSGVVLLTEDDAGRAVSIATPLAGLGAEVALVRHAEQTRIVGPGHYHVNLLSTEAVEQLRVWLGERGKVTSLLHLLPLDPGPDANPAQCLELRSLFHLTRCFGPELQESQGTICAVTQMDDSPSVDCSPIGPRPGQAAVPGFMKSLALEWPDVIVKSLDIDPATSNEQLSLQLTHELTCGDAEVEVEYSNGTRFIVHPEASELITSGEPEIDIDEDSVLLVTGGARGITAAVCETLAERYRPTLILVGRSPLPNQTEDPETVELTTAAALKQKIVDRRRRRGQLVTPEAVESEYQGLVRAREVRTTLDRLKLLGATCEYHSLDLRSGPAFEQLIEDLYERHGRIDGVIHGAGIVEDRRITEKSPSSFDAVFDTKVVPALVLARSLRPESLRFLALFSSVAGRFGQAGSTDYAAANEVLNKLAVHLDRQWRARVVAIGWGPWDEVGLATNYPDNWFSQRGLVKIPLRDGCECFVDEIKFGSKGDAEVLIYSPTGTPAKADEYLATSQIN